MSLSCRTQSQWEALSATTSAVFGLLWVLVFLSGASSLSAQGIVHVGGNFRVYNTNHPPPLSLAEAYTLAAGRMGDTTNRFFCINAILETRDLSWAGWVFGFSNTNGENARVKVRFNKEVSIDSESEAVFQGNASAYKAVFEGNITDRAKLELAVQTLESEGIKDPSNRKAALGLVEGYRKLEQYNKAALSVDKLLNIPALTYSEAAVAAQACLRMDNLSRLEACMDKLVTLAPGSPETWYDCASVKVSLGKLQDSLAALEKAVNLSTDLKKKDLNHRDLLVEAQKDPRFAPVREMPEYKKLVGRAKTDDGASRN